MGLISDHMHEGSPTTSIGGRRDGFSTCTPEGVAVLVLLRPSSGRVSDHESLESQVQGHRPSCALPVQGDLSAIVGERELRKT